MVIHTTIDLRNLAPFERHEKIFSTWNNLNDGESVKIINDHDPLPLYYLFLNEYKDKFEWKYELKGPSDWIFEIKKVDKNKKEKLKKLIKNLKSNDDIENVKKEGKDFLKNISASDLGLIEQEIINEGISRKEMRKLCDLHLEVMKDSLHSDLKLEKGHPIHTLMEEHKMILNFVSDMDKVVNEIAIKKDFNSASDLILKLKSIAKHLVEADLHHKREEDVLFVEMIDNGVVEPPSIMLEEHIDLKKHKKDLYDATIDPGKNFSGFVIRIKKDSDYIKEELPNHIYKEDNILYPMAIEVIPKSRWKNIKAECDNIGYCCFTPK